MKYIRLPLYILIQWFKSVFCYPVRVLDVSISQDYDAYWGDERGKNIGELSVWQKQRADIILHILRDSKRDGIQIGDIGCGDGSILLYLKRNLAAISRCAGYDTSNFALAAARAQGIEAHLLDISDRGAYDRITEADYCLMLEVLEHVIHSEELLLAAIEKSREGVFFSFPNTGYMRHRLRFLFGKFPLQWYQIPNEHLRFWTHADLKWWLSALGIKKYTIFPYQGIPVLNKILPGLFAAAFVVFVPRSR